MGTSASVEVRRSKEIDAEINKSKAVMFRTVKLLLLGTAECGKSTILKQMRIKNRDVVDEKTQKMQRRHVMANISQAIMELLSAMERLQLNYANKETELDASRLKQFFTGDSTIKEIPDQTRDMISRFWTDEGVKKCYERSNEYQLIDSAKYFLDRINQICANDYLPSQDDTLHIRTQTLGAVEVNFNVREHLFRVFDVGGQRSERKKWIHLFDDVKAIIYISAASEFDQVLREDGSTNRLRESLMLFKTIASSQWFSKTTIILFLNKMDILKEKLKHGRSIKSAFQSYEGADNFEESINYIQRRFRSAAGEKEVFCHQTCATDSKQVAFVITATLDSILTKSLTKAGVIA